MSTYMANPQNVERKWLVLDATDKPLGRVATEAAKLLRGKHKTTFTPHVDCGDFVIIVNASKAILTGNKANDKMHRWHTGWIGGLKEISYGKLMETNPEKAMTIAVKGMIPDTVIGRKALTRLKVYAGAEHNNAAQKPEVYEF